MTKRQVSKLAPGIYHITWRPAGYSIAAVGVTETGGRWLAPLNWVRPTEDQSYWRQVIKAVALECFPEAPL